MTTTRRDILRAAAAGAFGLAAARAAQAADPAVAAGEGGKPVAWVYTDRLSAAPGETVGLHLSASAPTASLRLERAGLEPKTVWSRADIPVSLQPVPDDASTEGCRWPETLRLTVGDWPSGYYRIIITAGGVENEHMLCVRPAVYGRDAKIMLVLTTNTLHAYNYWGGKSLYSKYEDVGSSGQLKRDGTKANWVSTQRPFGPGLISGHPDSPRFPNFRSRKMGERPFYEGAKYIFQYGFNRWDFAAGFMNKWEHHFVRWCEANGYALDYCTKYDLDTNPDLLKAYKLYMSVGHDEYWTWDERDAVEGFTEAGGNSVFFSGNVAIWQIRWEENGARMVGYKADAENDPVYGTPRQHLTTGLFSHPITGRPENEMTGVSFTRGGFANVGFATSRGIGGYIIYNSDHWALDGSDLEYGDVLGAKDKIVAWETDGCLFQFEGGLPKPTGEDGTPLSFEIIGMAPATYERPDRGYPREALLLGGDYAALARTLYGEATERTIGKVLRGHCVMGAMPKGKGQVFTTGCMEWSYGLAGQDPFVDRITHNILRRFTA